MSPVALVFVLLLAATILAGLARRLGIPDPIVLVIGVLILGLLPGVPEVELEPDLVFLLFLPPILFGAGYFTSIRDFKANLRAILLLSVGLVLFTMTAVAIAVHWVLPELGWPLAFATGAIVAPPDAVAATSVFNRLGAPRRMVTILEGESLVNDATALVALRTALAAAMGGTFSLVDASTSFVFVAVGGILVGLVIGTIAWRIIARVDDTILAIVLTLLIPLGIYAPAEELFGVSGVLAVVTAGLIAGRGASHALTSAQRVLGEAAWGTVLFLINGAVFVLIGLQLPIVLHDIGAERSPLELLGIGAFVSFVTVAARIIWVFPATYLPRWASSRIRGREPYPKATHVAVVSWAGMRGVVSLAAALALPEDLAGRSLVIFCTFCVILTTLVFQGLTLPTVIRALRIRSDGEEDGEEREARLMAVQAAVERITSLEEEWPDHRELVDQLRAQYEHRVVHIDPDGHGPRDEAEQELLEHRQIRHAVIEAEREAVIRLRDDGRISDDVMRRVERDLDLEELRLEA
jgi:CPA1 family monovalent cation:H+ antiporter